MCSITSSSGSSRGTGWPFGIAAEPTLKAEGKAGLALAQDALTAAVKQCHAAAEMAEAACRGASAALPSEELELLLQQAEREMAHALRQARAAALFCLHLQAQNEGQQGQVTAGTLVFAAAPDNDDDGVVSSALRSY